MPRFVLLYHKCPPGYERPFHWDLMLEANGTLRTWALARLPRDWRAIQHRTADADPNCPPIASDNSVGAEQLPDHRLDYLHQEGPLSNNRGHVSRIDAGTYVTETEAAARWEIHLTGGELCGKIALRQHSPGSAQWMLTLKESKV